MRSKVLCALIFAIGMAFAGTSGHAQVAPQAHQALSPLTIGAGLSDYDLDWGLGRRMLGITAWVDWKLPFKGKLLNGLGIEAEGRDTNFARPSTLSNMRQDTALGGVYYKFDMHHHIHPYVKALAGIGSIDFEVSNPTYHHDTRTVIAPGGGVDYHVWNGLSVRGDYEYQFWHALFGPHDLTPQGFTIGAVYSFGGRADN